MKTKENSLKVTQRKDNKAFEEKRRWCLRKESLFVDFNSAFNTISPGLLERKLPQLIVPASTYHLLPEGHVNFLKWMLLSGRPWEACAGRRKHECRKISLNLGGQSDKVVVLLQAVFSSKTQGQISSKSLPEMVQRQEDGSRVASQRPYLNPIENMWWNLTQFEPFYMEELSTIAATIFADWHTTHNPRVHQLNTDKWVNIYATLTPYVFLN